MSGRMIEQTYYNIVLSSGGVKFDQYTIYMGKVKAAFGSIDLYSKHDFFKLAALHLSIYFL